MSLTASIVITTKSRRDELVKAIESCLKLLGNPEIFIFDDGSNDDTFDYVSSNYSSLSQITLHREEISLGLINARTKAAGMAKGDIIFSIDDDCCFDDEYTLVEILKYFTSEKIAAVSIPAIDVLKNPNLITQKPIGRFDEVFITPQYRGCAHAIRKRIFLEIGGYRKDLIRQEEETDIAIRLYKNGYFLRIGSCSKPILHYHSAIRNEKTITFYQARNKCMIAYVHAPSFLAIPELLRIVLSMFFYSIKRRCIKAGISGVNDALKNIFSKKISREPQSFSAFLFYKNLRRKGFIKINL